MLSSTFRVVYREVVAVKRHAHQDLHSERGAVRGEHPGRSRRPLVEVADLAWLEFEKPDLDRAAVFAQDFGFALAHRTPEALYLRGTFHGPPCLVIRRGPASRFCGPAFRAAEASDQTVTLVDGTASASFNPLSKGSHSVTGNYNGDVSFAGSTGITVQTVV